MLRKIILLAFLSSNLLFALQKGKEKIDFNFRAETYFKNNEYATIPGYTLSGYNVFPSFEYRYQDKAKIVLAGLFTRYSGDESFHKSSPFLEIEVNLSEKFSATLGNFFVEENLITPLQEQEKRFEDFHKSGVKFKFENEANKYLLWIDWQKFIFPQDDKQEEFAVGCYGKTKLLGDLYLPFQGVITHKGGEIDSAKIVLKDSLQEAPIQSVFSLSPGLGYSLCPSLQIEGYYLRFSEATGVKRLLASEGNGFYLLARFHAKKNNLILSYFSADDFYCSQGNELFWSTNEENNDNKNLKNISLFYSYKIDVSEDIEFECGLDNVYNLKNQELNYSYMFKICADLQVLNLF